MSPAMPRRQDLFWLGGLGIVMLQACASCKAGAGAGCGVTPVGLGAADSGVPLVDAASALPESGGGDPASTAVSVFAAGVRWLGRVDTITDPDRPRFGWSATGFVAGFTGGSLSVSLANDGPFVFKAVVDGEPQPAFAATPGQGTYLLADSLPIGAHTLTLTRQTEGWYGTSQLLALTVDGGALTPPPPPTGRLIEVVGASVSCGYGDLGTAPCSFSFANQSSFDSYESVAARAVGAELSVVAISGRGAYRNSDGSFTGTMPLLYDRILATTPAPAWDFRTTAQVVVINLGKNDLATGDPGAAFVDGYIAFTRTLRARYPGALIVCTTGPNLGDTAHAIQLAYVGAAIDARHADGDDRIDLLDWPEDTADEQGCEGHPNAAKHQTMGDALAGVLRARLGW